MQRLIKNLRRADETNLDAIIDKVVKLEEKGGIESSLRPWNGPRLDQIRAEDGAAAQSIDVFFPGAFRGVQVADKLNAGECQQYFAEAFALLDCDDGSSHYLHSAVPITDAWLLGGRYDISWMLPWVPRSQGLLQYGSFLPSGHWQGPWGLLAKENLRRNENGEGLNYPR